MEEPIYSPPTPQQPEPTPASPSGPQPYRVGYREGFRDGYGEAERKAKEQDDADKRGKKDGGAGGKGDDEKDGDKKGDDEKDGDKKDDDKKDDDKKDGDEKDGDENKKPLYKRPLVVAGVLLLILVLIIVAIVFWRHAQHHETTDDAFIDGYTSQIAAQTGGRVTRLYVVDNQHVNAGDRLVDIDSRDNDVRLAQAQGQLASAQGQYEEAQAQIAVRRAAVAEQQANVRQAEADLVKTVQDLRRYRIVNPDAVPRQQVDAAESAERMARAKRDAAVTSVASARAQVEAALAQVRSGKAQVEASQAQVDAAKLQASYNQVVAPISGRVAKRTVDVGNVINSGQALMAIASDKLWVTANYKETQLTDMKPGQAVSIVVDAYPDVTFHGKVDSIQRATGAYFSMLPAENATGNYVKVVQRVPVKIVFDDDHIRDYVIGLGMSVTPNVTLP